MSQVATDNPEEMANVIVRHWCLDFASRGMALSPEKEQRMRRQVRALLARLLPRLTTREVPISREELDEIPEGLRQRMLDLAFAAADRTHMRLCDVFMPELIRILFLGPEGLESAPAAGLGDQNFSPVSPSA